MSIIVNNLSDEQQAALLRECLKNYSEIPEFLTTKNLPQNVCSNGVGSFTGLLIPQTLIAETQVAKKPSIFDIIGAIFNEFFGG